MSVDEVKALGAKNPEMFQVLGAYVSYERKLRLIRGATLAAPPSFAGPDGREVFLDEIGMTEEGAVAAIRNVAVGKYETAAKAARDFLKRVYDVDGDLLQAWVDDVLPPEAPAKQLDKMDAAEGESDSGDAASVGGEAAREEINP